MIQFHETGYGRKFFEQQLPDLTRAINKLAEATEKAAKVNPPDSTLALATTNLIKVATETTRNIVGFDGADELDAAIDLAMEAVNRKQ